MYCYKCLQNGKIRYVPPGLSECIIGHNIHVGLDDQLEIPDMIERLKMIKEHKQSDYIREYVKNNKQL